MNLEELTTLCKEYNGILEEIERKKKYSMIEVELINEGIECLKKRLEELKRNSISLDSNDPLMLEKNGVYNKISRLVGKYGIFNLQDMGNILADLATRINGVSHTLEFNIDRTLEFTCLIYQTNHCGLAFAAIKEENSDVVLPEYYFAVSSGKGLCFPPSNKHYSESGMISLYEPGLDCANSHKRCLYRNLREVEELTIYNPSLKSFEFKQFSNIKVVDFIRDFLVFVSNYRLQNGLKEINKNQLRNLEELFLETYGDRYIRHSKSGNGLKLLPKTNE